MDEELASFYSALCQCRKWNHKEDCASYEISMNCPVHGIIDHDSSHHQQQDGDSESAEDGHERGHDYTQQY